VALLVGDVFRHAAAVTPTATAASLAADAMTFAELDDAASRVAGRLAATGLGPGARVAWQGETSLDAVALFAGLAKLGAVFMPLSPRLSPAETDRVLELARPDVVLADLGPLTDSLSRPGPALDARWDTGLDERASHVVFFTSGSTGRPKGVVLSHRTSCLRSFPPLAVAADGGTVCMFPLFHMAGWSLALGAWQARRAVHLVHAPDAPTLLETAARRRASRVYCIPAVWARILDHGVEGYDLRALREADTGTSATPPELLRALRAALPDTVTRVFYGSTEVGPGTVLAAADVLRKPGSVGLPQAGVSLRLSESGEVCLRSELMMDGYLDDPEATAAAVDADGWYHSGDLGVLDDEGYLSIVGRVRDVLRTGGETVAPTEVEAVLATHPAVAEVAVVGIPDADWGDVVCAVVVARTGFPPPALEDLRAHCSGALASFKHPRRLEVVDALPRTGATGQVQRTLIVERLLAGGT
jgi:acyl-CoA synthetase (AMP-forming)/AMP-acid ligase II